MHCLTIALKIRLHDCLIACLDFGLGTVEAGTGAEGEGLKRKRGDDMAALEADLEPPPGRLASI